MKITSCATLALALAGTLATSGAQQSPIVEHGAHPSVSPDGRHVAFVSNRDGLSDVYVTDANGGDVVRITNSTASEGLAGWSADSKYLIYSTAAGDTAMLFSAAASGGTVIRIGTVVGKGARVSSDGKQVLYGEMPWQTMQVYVASLDGSNRIKVTDGTAAYYCSAFSPDAEHIASSRSATGPLQVWTFGVAGGAGTQITHFTETDGSAQCPSWSANGQLLAVQSDVANKTNAALSSSHIWIVNVATGAATKLGAHTQPYLDELPSWFPNGKRIAFQSNRTGRWEIWTMNADGSDAKLLTK